RSCPLHGEARRSRQNRGAAFERSRGIGNPRDALAGTRREARGLGPKPGLGLLRVLPPDPEREIREPPGHDSCHAWCPVENVPREETDYPLTKPEILTVAFDKRHVEEV